MQWLDRLLNRNPPLPGPQYWEGGGPPYCTTDSTKELRQGEIISNLKYYTIQPAGNQTKLDVVTLSIPYALVGTPDWYLFQECKTPANKIMGVLLYPIEELEVAKARTAGNTQQWRWVKGNQVSQFYKVGIIAVDMDAHGTGIPDLVADLKRYFTPPAAEIYRQCLLPNPGGATRRCRLNDIWREDFRQRALSYMGRIAVPGDADDL